MLKFLLYTIIIIHGLIHLIGFAEAFRWMPTPQFTKHISPAAGISWLLTALLFLVAVGLLTAGQREWWQVLTAAILVSQFLIFLFWHDAKWGTLPNVILILVAVAAFSSWQFENEYQKDVALAKQAINNTHELLTEKDLEHLPAIVQQYIIRTGGLQQPKVKSFRVVFDGEMRDKGKDWFTFRSEQYNTIQPASRQFFMKAKMFGITVPGYHRYTQSKATMQIKLFGLIPVVDIGGTELSQAETVTLFNDMCLMAPASLIDPRIQWQPIDSLRVKATFTNAPYTISAELVFNPAGELINFFSDDRYAIADMKKYRFATPLSQYQKINSQLIGTYGEAIWHYPDGEFVYGKFYLKEVEYNPSR
ncbi:MAG: DUF6544 family protein [Bacteroidota bacterium]|jgi:hypothetical protein|nr:hypothetical protein [Cytophagales bacterium]